LSVVFEIPVFEIAMVDSSSFPIEKKQVIVITRKRGKGQRDGRPPLFYTDAELLCQHANISLPWQTGVGREPI